MKRFRLFELGYPGVPKFFTLGAILMCSLTASCSPSYLGRYLAGPSASARIQADYLRTHATLRQKVNGFDTVEEQTNPLLLSLLWKQVAEWVVVYLNEHPEAAINELEARIEELGLVASIIPFQRGGEAGFVVAVSDDVAGTLFIVSRTPARKFSTVWHMKDMVAGHLVSNDEIGHWVASAQDGRPGLYPSVGELPPSSRANPRFYLDSSYYFQGSTGPKQLILWEWDGEVAWPLIVGAYMVMIDSKGGIHFDHDLLTVDTKEHFSTFFTNGASEEPRGIWSIRITPDQVEDLGRRFLVPELQFLDQLFYRIQRRQVVDDIASPAVAQHLTNLIPDARCTLTKDNDYEPLGEMWGWRRLATQQGFLVCLDITASGPLVYTIEYRNGRPYVADIQEPTAQGAIQGVPIDQSSDPYESKCR